MTATEFKSIRIKAGLSQEALALQLGYKGRDIIARYERGSTPIPVLVERFMRELEREPS